MNFLGKVFQKLEHYSITDRQTDRQTDGRTDGQTYRETDVTERTTMPHSQVV